MANVPIIALKTSFITLPETEAERGQAQDAASSFNVGFDQRERIVAGVTAHAQRIVERSVGSVAAPRLHSRIYY